MAARNIGDLAIRLHLRLKQYRRNHPERPGLISDSMSRILEHDPTYQPLRPRKEVRQRPPLSNPGVFTLQRIAESLETTVGDLLGEPYFRSLTERVSRDQRRTIRDATRILRHLLDLDDPTL